MPPLHLSVRIDPNSGFCFGVIYAIQMAEDLLDEQGYLYCLGDIVHNDEEVQRLEARGLRIICHERLADLHNEAVLIRAHGEPPATYQMAMANNLTLIDASLPGGAQAAKTASKPATTSRRKYLSTASTGTPKCWACWARPAATPWCSRAWTSCLATSCPKTSPSTARPPKAPPASTTSRANWKTRGYQVNANDTICRQVSNRDKDLRRFAAQYDQVVFVSGTKSSNGKVLYQVCRETNPHTHFISNVAEIDSAWFGPGQSVGICGATSTPMWLMEQVRDRLLSL